MVQGRTERRRIRVGGPHAELTTAPASSCTYRHVIRLIYQPRRKVRALD